MANGNIDQKTSKNKAESAMSSERILLIEGRVDRLEGDVSEIKNGVKELLQRPATAGYGQLIGVIATTLVVCSLIFGFAEWRLWQAVQPVQDRVNELVNRDMNFLQHITDLKIKMAVLEERSIWMKSQLSWAAKTVASN